MDLVKYRTLLAVQNIRIALKKAVFALDSKKRSIITLFNFEKRRVMVERFVKPKAKIIDSIVKNFTITYLIQSVLEVICFQ